VIEQFFLDRVAVEPGDGAQPPGDRGPGAAAGFQIAGEEVDVGAYETRDASITVAHAQLGSGGVWCRAGCDIVVDVLSADLPFASRYVQVRGSRMHYFDVGEGRPFLLLHGNPTWSYLWRNVIPHLEPLGRVIAVDLIGMGRSDKPAIGYRYGDHYAYLEGFIDALGLEGVTLVLHDWGSVLGFRYAMEHEARIRAIAFMEANVRPRYSWAEFEGPAGELFRQFRAPGIGWDLLIEQNMMIERVLPGAVLRPLTQTEMDYYREPYLLPEHRLPLWRWPSELPIAGEPADVFAIVDTYSTWLQRSPLPKLLLHADPGAIITEPIRRWCEVTLKNLTSVSVGPGIHFIQEDNPDGIGQAIAAWFVECLGSYPD
jgi:haloalkane dehalogenase